MQPWRTRFFIIWTGQALSLLGSGLVQFALVWWLTTSTGSATVLARATLFAMLPGVLVGPFAGVIADRWNRRLILMLADGTVALATLLLLAVYAAGGMEVWHVYLAMFVRSAAGAFHYPTMAASTALLVPQEHLTRVSGLNQSLQGVTSIAAPVLGALLLAVADLRAVLAIDIVTALLAIVPLFYFAIPQPALTAEQRLRGTGAWVLHDLRDGFRSMRTRRGLLHIVVMATVINLLLTPAFSLLPLLINKEFGGGPGALATAETVFGVGVILGGGLLAAWGGFRHKMTTSLVGLIGIGAGTVLIGIAPLGAFWLLLVGILVVGVMQAWTNGPIMAIFQTVVEPAMQARVLALLSSIATAMAPLGLLVAGPVADALGVRSWYLMGAVVCAAMGVGGFFLPALRALDDHAIAIAQETIAQETIAQETIAQGAAPALPAEPSLPDAAAGRD